MAGFGLIPKRHIDGSPWNGAVHRVHFAAANGTATFIGDTVKLSVATGSTGAGEEFPSGIISVIQGTVEAACYGVLVGLEPDRGDLTKQYRVASTARVGYVCMDPTVVYWIEEDGAGTPVALASVGLNANVIVGSGDTTTGRSAMQLDSSTVATTNTLDLKVLGLAQFADNNRRVGNSSAPLAVWEVLLNNLSSTAMQTAGG